MDGLMQELLGRLAATSVQTVLLVALVGAITRLLPRMAASTQCWMWWLVGVQALVGLCAAPLELAWWPASAPPPVPRVPAVDAGVAAAAPPGFDWTMLLAALWLAGVAWMGVRSAFAWRASRRLLADAIPAGADLVGALALAAEAHGLRRVPPLRLSPRIASPQLVGPWRPVLLLPATPLPADALDLALTHELVHLQRHDLRWGWVPVLARHLFFFNPLLHLAVREYGIAREAACDAAVVAGSRHCRHDYGRLLLRLGVAPRSCAGLASASPTFRSLKRRLVMLQHTASLPRPATSLLLAAVALVGVVPFRIVAAVPEPAIPASTAAADIADPAVARTPLSAADEADLAARDIVAERSGAAVEPAAAHAPPAVRTAASASPATPAVTAPPMPGALPPPPAPPAPAVPPSPPVPPMPPVPAAPYRTHVHVIRGGAPQGLGEADRKAIAAAAEAARQAGAQARREVEAQRGELARLSAALGSQAAREAMDEVRRELAGIGPQIAQAQAEARRARADGMAEQRRARVVARAAVADIDAAKIARDVREAVDEAMRATAEASRAAAEARDAERD